MKTITQIAALSFLFITIVGGCKKKSRDLEGPSSKLEGIQDVWVLDQVQQLDPSNKDLVIDVTDVFKDSTPIELDVKSSDFSYAFNRSNPLFLGTSGKIGRAHV
jgi:hypothetical protein